VREAHIRHFLKKTGITLAAAGLKALVGAKNIVAWIGRKVFKKPFFWLGGVAFNYLLLPFYKGLLFIEKQIGKVYQPTTSNKFWEIVTHRYIIHLVIIVLGVLVITNNISAQISGFRNEDYGKQTILYSLAVESDQMLVEESSIDSTQASSYLGYQEGLKAGATALALPEEAADNTAITQGGTAVINPEISSMEGDVVREKEQTYVVQSGDTVESIAAKFGVSVQTILWENNLSARSLIRPGDKLVVLPGSGVTHKIKRGETLDKIAAKYNVSKEDILAYNDLIDESAISIGEELFIPGGKKIATPLPAPTAPASTTPRSYVGAPPPSAVPSDTRLQWPTSSHAINQYYSWRHTGLDVDGDIGNPIYAADDGVVIRASATAGTAATAK